MTPNSRDRFLNLMAGGVMIAGVVWLGLALYNARQGSSFSWTGLVIFLVLVAGLLLARARRPRV